MVCRRKGDGPCLAVTGDNRYHAILGGKRCFSVCPSDTAIALAALDGRLRIAGPTGDRFVNAVDFYHHLGNVLGDGEMITHIHVPRPPAGNRQVFLKHRIRGSIDFALVSVGLVLALRDDRTCSLARLSIGAVAPGPYRAFGAEDLLLGRAICDRTAEAAAEAALKDAVPLSSNAYKVKIAKTLIKRALQMCS